LYNIELNDEECDATKAAHLFQSPAQKNPSVKKVLQDSTGWLQ